MVATNNPEKCCYCQGCPIVCPVQAIEMFETKIVIDAEKCTNCGLCVRVCPVGAMSIVR